jgi:hypothetical protein
MRAVQAEHVPHTCAQQRAHYELATCNRCHSLIPGVFRLPER